ncbi:MAG TPA: AAA family ATPase [Thermoanaerobaculia bacterium]|nr:AAA family ATPase [Thermoanaerobaculia bacterium]
MRIDRLELAAYGPFTNVSIEFDREIGLHVVFGPNEAGKSSALRAVSDLLFGVPTQTTDNFLHAYDALRIRATITARDGRTLDFVRRKGRSGSDLLDASRRALARDVLVPFLGSAERDFFERSFGLDPRRLAAGAMDLLQSGGDVGRAVLQATSGLSGLSARLDAIEAAAGELFKERGKTQPINAALSRLKELEREVRSDSLSAETWRSLDEELAHVRREAMRLADRRTANDVEQQRLSRIRQALPILARRTLLMAAVERLAGVPLLAAEFDATAQAAREELLSAAAAEAGLASDLTSLEEEVSKYPAVGPILLRGTEIEALHQECGTMREFRKDLPKRDVELREATAQATRLAAEIVPGLGLDALLDEVPRRPVRRALRASAGRARGLRDDLAREERELATARESIRAAEAKLASLGPAVDPAPLARALRDAERSGDPVESLGKAEQAEKRARKALDEALASLPGWAPRGADPLAALPVPGDALIDSFQKRFSDLETAERDLENERRSLASQRSGRESERRNLAAGGTLPTRAAVGAARETRTKGWTLVRRVYVEREPGAEDEARLFDPERPLVEAFERSVETADGAADRLVDAADVAAKDAELSRQLREIDEALAGCGRRAEELAVRRAAAEHEWRAAWPAEGVAPGAPASMKEWLRARSRTLERLDAFRGATAEVEAASSALERARVSLVSAVALVRPEGPPPPAAYPEAETFVEELRRALEKTSAERGKLEATIEAATGKAGAREIAVAQARTALEEWKTSWAEEVRPLRRSPTVSTEEVEAVLDACDEFESVAGKVPGLRDRVKKMQDRLEEFAASVGTLCADVAPDLQRTDAVVAAGTLFERLGAERAAEGKRVLARENLVKIREKLAKESKRSETARRSVEAICREAGCAGESGLPARLAEIAEKRRAVKDLGEAESDLLAVGAGRSPSDLATECADVDGDALPALLEKARDERKALDEEIGRLHKREGELGQSLEIANGGDVAATRGQEAASVRARIEEDARRWLRLRASAFLLRRAIDGWRKENQDPLLVEATQLFSSLTKGRFVSLLAEVDDHGDPVITAGRAEGRHVPMAGLSDGTRDQLFLALRLASVRRYAKDAEPLPFIADDLLVSFDDSRAAAALETLSEFGKEVQVVLFTHHRHIVDLAKAHLAASAFRVHELLS